MLGIAVFFWGLQYKLSLYHSEQGAVPAAKLLSQRERPASSVAMASLLLVGQPLPVVPHKTLSDTHTAWSADAHLQVVNRSEELLGTSLSPRAPQPWHITHSSPRAPPMAA
jgi:hypothetical protein